MEIKEYLSYDEKEILALYESVGWTAYTENPAALRLGFAHSLLTLAAYEGERLLGLVRTVGDGHTIVFIQDILVHPTAQRKGIGTALMKAVLDRFPLVRQGELTTDNTAKTLAFYRSLGFSPMEELGLSGLMLL